MNTKGLKRALLVFQILVLLAMACDGTGGGQQPAPTMATIEVLQITGPNGPVSFTFDQMIEVREDVYVVNNGNISYFDGFINAKAMDYIETTDSKKYSFGLTIEEVQSLEAANPSALQAYAANAVAAQSLSGLGLNPQPLDPGEAGRKILLIIAASATTAGAWYYGLEAYRAHQSAQATQQAAGGSVVSNATYTSTVGSNTVNWTAGVTIAPSSIEMVTDASSIDPSLIVGTATDGTTTWTLVDASNSSVGGMELDASLPLHNPQHTPKVNPQAMAIAMAAAETVVLFSQGQGPDNATCTVTKAVVDGAWQIIGYGLWIPTATITGDVLGDYAMWSVRSGREGWVSAFSKMKQSKLLNISKSLELEFGPGNVARELIGCDKVPQPPSIDQNAPPPSFVQ